MREAFEERVHDVNRCKQTEENEERTVVRVIVGLVGDRFVDAAFAWEKEERGKKQNRRRDEDENEEQECPRLLVAPSVKDPPRHDQIKKQIYNPEEVHPIKAAV